MKKAPARKPFVREDLQSYAKRCKALTINCFEFQAACRRSSPVPNPSLLSFLAGSSKRAHVTVLGPPDNCHAFRSCALKICGRWLRGRAEWNVSPGETLRVHRGFNEWGRGRMFSPRNSGRCGRGSRGCLTTCRRTEPPRLNRKRPLA
jgi:hypothetical protein